MALKKYRFSSIIVGCILFFSACGRSSILDQNENVSCEDISGEFHKVGESCENLQGTVGEWTCLRTKRGILAQCKDRSETKEPDMHDRSRLGVDCDGDVCSGGDENVIGCDVTLFDIRGKSHCVVDYHCNNAANINVTCLLENEEWDCECVNGKNTGSFHLVARSTPEYYLDKLNAHCSGNYYIQP